MFKAVSAYGEVLMVRSWARRVGVTIATILIAATLLPLIPSNEWWIRIFDFPRAQIAVLLVLVLTAAATQRVWSTGRGLALTAALTACLAYQTSRILPYTLLWPEELPSVASCATADRFRFMEANVLQSNRDADALLSLVREQRPDVLLLTETDRWWSERVQVLAREMPHVISVPLENTYGMMLFSSRPLISPQVRYRFEPDVPSIRTGMTLGQGRYIEFHGVHPRPPVPGQDTAHRDAELVLVGREVRTRRHPSIVAGDLNDVAWSNTTALFQEVSGLLDPRVGRALMPTFPADLPLLRWPLDYVFVAPGFELLSIQRLKDINSDHLPIVLEFCSSKVSRASLPTPALSQETREEAREVLREGQAERAEH